MRITERETTNNASRELASMMASILGINEQEAGRALIDLISGTGRGLITEEFGGSV